MRSPALAGGSVAHRAAIPSDQRADALIGAGLKAEHEGEYVEAGKHYGCEVAVDLMCVADPASFAARVKEMGAAWVGVHCPIDAQMQGGSAL